MGKVGNRRGDVGVKPRLIEHPIGAARGSDRLVRGPAVARPHQPKIIETAIQHGARGGADILAELRLHQNDRGTSGHRRPAMVGSRHVTPNAR